MTNNHSIAHYNPDTAALVVTHKTEHFSTVVTMLNGYVSYSEHTGGNVALDIYEGESRLVAVGADCMYVYAGREAFDNCDPLYAVSH